MTERLQSGLEAVEQTSEFIAKELRMMAAGQGENYRRFTYVSPWIKNIWAAAADILEDRGRKNIHSMAALIAAIVLLGVGPAYAEDLAIGCMPKERLQAEVRNHHQSFLEQFVRKTSKGDVKTSVTSEHDGKGYVLGGTGYIIESHDKEACIVAKTRFDPVSGSDRVIVSTVHTFGGVELTAAEHVRVAETALKNPEKRKAQWIAKGIDEARAERWLEGLKIIQKNRGLPGELSASLTYQILPDKILAVERNGL